MEKQLLDAEESHGFTQRDVAAIVGMANKKQAMCTTCEKPNHSAENCWTTNACEKCGELGHGKRYCKGSSNLANNVTFSAYFSCSNSFSALSPSDDDDDIVVDSGATTNMFPNRDCFQTYKKALNNSLSFANGKTESVPGKGTVNLIFDKPLKMDALHLPSLSKALLSVHEATMATGGIFHFTGSKCWLTDDKNQLVAQGVVKNNEYIIKQVDQVRAVKLVKKNSLEIFHCSMGHRNIKDLVHLAKKKLLMNLPLQGHYNAFDCETCALMKTKRKPFPKQREADKNREILDKLTSDVCGKIPTPSISGFQYFVTYTDTKSLYRWTYLMKKKSEQAQIFKDLQNQLERQHDPKIKILLSDNGGEYVSHDFDGYLKSQGIQHQTTVKECSAQNGLSERLNFTLIDIARSMLHFNGSPKSF